MKKTAIILLVLFTAAFAVRLGYNVFVAGLNTSPSVYYGADDGDYDAIGWNLVSGKGYSITPGELTADRTPWYPLFLSALYKIFGRSYPAVRIVQSLLGALSCLLIYIIAKRVFGHGTALLAAAIYCVYPFAVYYTELVYTETLFISLLLLFALCMMKIKSQANSLYFLFCGLLLGYLTLVKPQMLIFFPVMAVWCFYSVSRSVKAFFKFLSLALAGFMIMLMPWFARNYLVFKEPWLMRAAAGEGVLVAINDKVYRNFNERYFISRLR